MAEVESQMPAIGMRAPEFCLPDPDNELHALKEGADAYLVIFICNHCPFVKHIREELARLGRSYSTRNVAIYAINSNDATAYPADGPANMKKEAQDWGYSFPYLIDADQSVAKAYRAACTPDFFAFDAERLLVYRGQLDSSRPSNNHPVDGRDLRAALDATLAGTPVNTEQKPSIGCSIKWKPGNAPNDY
jgi:peroxiredoxin